MSDDGPISIHELAARMQGDNPETQPCRTCGCTHIVDSRCRHCGRRVTTAKDLRRPQGDET